MEPAVVLAANQVQRAPKEPAGDEGALGSQLAIDVGRRQPGGAGADGQPRRAELLGLHRKQPPDDLWRGSRPDGVEQLCGGSSGAKLGLLHAPIIPARSAARMPAQNSGRVEALLTEPS